MNNRQQSYSPPFRIQAIGNPERLRRALDRSPGVSEYRLAVEYFGLRYVVKEDLGLRLPGYDGPLRLGYAEAATEDN